MVETLNYSPNITFKEARATDFFDYGGLFDIFYDKFPPSKIQQNHIFWVEDVDPTKMYLKRSDEADFEKIDFKKSFVADRTRQLQSYIMTAVEAPGLKEIKQVELWSKFRKFVPPEFQDEICPRPSDEVLKNIKKNRSQKTNARNARKRQALARIG